MKDINDNKTVDWVSSAKSQIIGFERVLAILNTIRAKPFATSRHICKELSLGLRTAQRYTKQLEAAGYIKNMSCDYHDENRYLLTQKAQQLFGGAA